MLVSRKSRLFPPVKKKLILCFSSKIGVLEVVKGKIRITMITDRRSLRLELSFPVFVELGGVVKRCMAADVSDQGMLILSQEPFQIGEELNITFSLPWTDVELSVSSEVLHNSWCTALSEKGHFRVGLRFLDFHQGEIHPPLRCLPI